jgi:hypothetical protein
LVVVLDAAPGQRRVIKYEHTQLDLENDRRPPMSWFETAGYGPTVVSVGFGSLDQAASHHVEVTPPPGVELIGALLVAHKTGLPAIHLGADMRNPDIAHLRFTAEDAQAVISKERRELDIKVRVWPSRGPLRTLALLISMLNVVILGGGLLLTSLGPSLGWDIHPGTAGAAILVAAPAALSIVAATQEHGLTYRVQRVLRVQLALGIVVSFLVAASLALTGFQADQLSRVWGMMFWVAVFNLLWVASSRMSTLLWRRG